MKTAISVPDAVFEAAERLARRLGTSRSELYTRALRDYLEEHRNERVTERLDEVYSSPEASKMDDVLMDLQIRSVGKEDW